MSCCFLHRNLSDLFYRDADTARPPLLPAFVLDGARISSGCSVYLKTFKIGYLVGKPQQICRCMIEWPPLRQPGVHNNDCSFFAPKIDFLCVFKVCGLHNSRSIASRDGSAYIYDIYIYEIRYIYIYMYIYDIYTIIIVYILDACITK